MNSGALKWKALPVPKYFFVVNKVDVYNNSLKHTVSHLLFFTDIYRI